MTVRARTKDTISAMMTLSAMGPTNSPAAPGSRVIGMKARTVVAVELRSGSQNRATVSRTASRRDRPRAMRRETASQTTMAASTRSPNATIMPVTDI